jgi:DNA-binding NarL/FixJ family response regulator
MAPVVVCVVSTFLATGFPDARPARHRYPVLVAEPNSSTVRHVRVVLAEDHPAVAAQLRAVLAQEFEVLAVVHSATDLLDAVDHLRPDVVVTDITMPGLSGLDALPAILLRRPSTRVVIVTVHADRELVERAFSLGAAGYVVKGDAGDELNAAVRTSLAGQQYLSAAVSAHH